MYVRVLGIARITGLPFAMPADSNASGGFKCASERVAPRTRGVAVLGVSLLGLLAERKGRDCRQEGKAERKLFRSARRRSQTWRNDKEKDRKVMMTLRQKARESLDRADAAPSPGI